MTAYFDRYDKLINHLSGTRFLFLFLQQLSQEIFAVKSFLCLSKSFTGTRFKLRELIAVTRVSRGNNVIKHYDQKVVY